MDSELEISRKLITRFVKRIYTDKVIIAFTTLIVLGLVGIIVYATLNPNQSVSSERESGDVNREREEAGWWGWDPAAASR